MIFIQNWQTPTKRNHSYGTKEFDRFWVKMALYRPETYVITGLQTERRGAN